MEFPPNRRQRLMTPTRFGPNQVGVARSEDFENSHKALVLWEFFCAPNWDRDWLAAPGKSGG
jgi:hypothetical protein